MYFKNESKMTSAFATASKLIQCLRKNDQIMCKTCMLKNYKTLLRNIKQDLTKQIHHVHGL